MDGSEQDETEEFVENVNYEIQERTFTYQVPREFEFKMDDNGRPIIDIDTNDGDNPLNWSQNELDGESISFKTVELKLPEIVPNKSVSVRQAVLDNIDFIVEKAIERVREAFQNDWDNVNIVSINTQQPLSISGNIIASSAMQSAFINLGRENFYQFFSDKLKDFEEMEKYEMCQKIHNFMNQELLPKLNDDEKK